MYFPLAANVIFVLVVGVILVNLYIEMIVINIFKHPINQKPSIEKESWKVLNVNCRGIEARALLNRRKGSGPLLLMVHGWRSSAESVRERAEWFCEQGWHALIVEMPGHGEAMSVNKWTALRVVEHIVELMGALNSKLSQKEITHIVYYGHSMGGFVGLNLSKRVNQYQWGRKIKGWILESPMTKYSSIFEDSLIESKVPKIFHSLIERRLFAQINALHPNEKPVQLLSQLDVPIFGLPKQPTLVIQAAEDNVLGRTHYDLLVKSMKEAGRESILETHVLDQLPHTGAQINGVRTAIIEQWVSELLIQ
jgi:pimeloyl-ACP methyl ester carboxylesterase